MAYDDGVQGSQPRSQDRSCGLIDPIEPRTLVIHRCNILNEMITAFDNPQVLDDQIEIAMVLPNGDVERGSGVLRDCFTNFWCEFYEQCTVGNIYCVPFLRHDFSRARWEAVARIIVKGWREVNYFPIGLALPFMKEVFFGRQKHEKDSLLKAYYLFLSDSEREVLEMAVTNVDMVDKAELMNVLNKHECLKIPTNENIATVSYEKK